MKQALKQLVFAGVLFALAASNALTAQAAEQQEKMTQAAGRIISPQATSTATTNQQPSWQTEMPHETQPQKAQAAIDDTVVSQAAQNNSTPEQEATWTIVSPQEPSPEQTQSSTLPLDDDNQQQSNLAPTGMQEQGATQQQVEQQVSWPTSPAQDAVVIEAPAEGQKDSTSSSGQAQSVPSVFPSDNQQQQTASPVTTQQPVWPPVSPPNPVNPASAQQVLPHALSLGAATKDDIVATIEEALHQYKNKDFAGAVSNLDYATHLIRQKKSELLKALLPEPFYGWQAKTATSQSLGTAVFGGGSTVSRDYFTQSGSAISIEIVSDSPVLQSIIMMLNNPLFAGASGGNLKTIKRQRAMIKYNNEEHSGEINIVVASRFIVTVKGRGIDLTWLLRYAEAMDFDALAKN